MWNCNFTSQIQRRPWDHVLQCFVWAPEADLISTRCLPRGCACPAVLTQVGAQARRGSAHCRATLVRVFLVGTSFLSQNLCLSWKHRLRLFVYSLEASKAASQSWRSAGKGPTSQGHICLMLQRPHCPRCSQLQGLSWRSSYLSKVNEFSCYPKLMHT